MSIRSDNYFDVAHCVFFRRGDVRVVVVAVVVVVISSAGALLRHGNIHGHGHGFSRGSLNARIPIFCFIALSMSFLARYRRSRTRRPSGVSSVSPSQSLPNMSLVVASPLPYLIPNPYNSVIHDGSGSFPNASLKHPTRKTDPKTTNMTSSTTAFGSERSSANDSGSAV